MDTGHYLSDMAFLITANATVCSMACLVHTNERRNRKGSELMVIWQKNPPVIGGLPYKGPVTRKEFPCPKVIMYESGRTWFMVC